MMQYPNSTCLALQSPKVEVPRYILSKIDSGHDESKLKGGKSQNLRVKQGSVDEFEEFGLDT